MTADVDGAARDFLGIVSVKRPWDAILWWELRRIPFNAAVGATGVACVAVLAAVGALPFLFPYMLWLSIIAYGVAANAAYTLGWVSEVLWSGGDTSRTAPYRSRVFWLALVFSMILTFSPPIVLPVLKALLVAYAGG